MKVDKEINMDEGTYMILATLFFVFYGLLIGLVIKMFIAFPEHRLMTLTVGGVLILSATAIAAEGLVKINAYYGKRKEGETEEERTSPFGWEHDLS